jgi:hypothetical protein
MFEEEYVIMDYIDDELVAVSPVSKDRKNVYIGMTIITSKDDKKIKIIGECLDWRENAKRNTEF